MSDGFQRVRRGDRYAHYWVAKNVSRLAKDYGIKTRRLSDDEGEAREQARVFSAELHTWLADRPKTPEFVGTVASLIDCYRGEEESPYHSVKANTRRDYDVSLDFLKRNVGHFHIATTTRKDFARWHRKFKTAPDGRQRSRRAWGCMKLLRTIAGFGASMEYPGCERIGKILAEMRFPMPPPRESSMTFEQASAIVDHALSIGRRSVALAQALQFETTLRQKDVIGEWSGGQWSGGVQWSHLSPDLILRKKTTKTKARSAWNLALCPLVMKVLESFPLELARVKAVAPEDREHPMIVCENTGRPYRPDPFRFTWRKIADAAGVPKDVWNMDSRSGGLTEADEAGADIHDIQRHATHSDQRTTGRYIRENLKANERVANIRVASRKKD